jgi:hypothetical protein
MSSFRCGVLLFEHNDFDHLHNKDCRPKAYVCGRSATDIVGLNPTGGMDVSVVSVVCCQVEVCATS